MDPDILYSLERIAAFDKQCFESDADADALCKILNAKRWADFESDEHDDPIVPATIEEAVAPMFFHGIKLIQP